MPQAGLGSPWAGGAGRAGRHRLLLLACLHPKATDSHRLIPPQGWQSPYSETKPPATSPKLCFS